MWRRGELARTGNGRRGAFGGGFQCFEAGSVGRRACEVRRAQGIAAAGRAARRRWVGGGSFSHHLPQLLGNRRKTHLSQRAFPARSGGQLRGEGQMGHHHHAHQGVETPRPDDVPVVGAPEHLQPAVDPLDGRAALVTPLELFGRPRDRREPPQVDVRTSPAPSCRTAGPRCTPPGSGRASPHAPPGNDTSTSRGWPRSR